MIKVRVPMMVDDARFAPLGRPEAIEGYDITGEEWFGDGPATERVAVVDRDLATGAVYPPARFVPPRKGHVLGRYALQEPYQVDSRTFNQVSTFATVMKTIRMFEESDALGRRVAWAFPQPQLTVLPRAGWGENAFYRRERGSLEFHYFSSRNDPSQIIYTSMARDIVAHETAHAIIDGIAPRLWEAITPQSLALHEAVADLTALLVSIRSRVLRSAVLRRTGGSIEHSSNFSAIGEEFGVARGSGALRDLKNDLRMSTAPRDPYRLSQVLTGALYSVFVKMHAQRTLVEAARRGSSEYSASGYGLWTAAEHLKRMTLRALDYLPPGEVSFADYGRAILAADEVSHPDDPQERIWMVDEFVRREIVPGREALEMPAAYLARTAALLEGTSLNELLSNDPAAYTFVNSPVGREVLSIPADVQPVLEPRLMVAKDYYHRSPDGVVWPVTVREGLLKVWWTRWEEGGAPPAACPSRRIAVGTTLSWDWDSGRVRVLLTANRRDRPTELIEERADRDVALSGIAGPQSPGDLPDNRGAGC
ncbi:MAG: hypothetical protein ACM30E_11085 [Nitrososphaerales archaeon]